MKMLLVEDDESSLSILQKIIKDNFQGVIYCSRNYSEALDILQTNTIDIFLLDIDLGEKYSGIQLGKEIRKIDIYRTSPIIFITALKAKFITAINDLHCYGYIVKPYRKELIISMLNEIIETGSNRTVNRLKIKKETFNTYVLFKDLIYIESQRKDLVVHTIDDAILYKNYTLIKILKELGPSFVQCHKKYIINVDFVKDYDYANDKVNFHGTKDIVGVGRVFKAGFKEALKCTTRA